MRKRGAAPKGAEAARARAAPERLQKLISQLGLGSRRQAEEWMKSGRLSVNGQPVALGTRVAADDQVRLDGRLIRQHAPGRTPVFLCHRAGGTPLLPSTTAGESLADRLPRSAGRRFVSISPMPTPDGGLELLSADGAMAARLQRAVGEQESEFSVRVRGELTEAQIGGALEGTLDSGERVRVLGIEPGGGEASNRWYQLTARGASGKQVRQLLERQGAELSRILRVRLGALKLDRTLSRGQFRELESTELDTLLQPPAPPEVAPP